MGATPLDSNVSLHHHTRKETDESPSPCMHSTEGHATPRYEASIRVNITAGSAPFQNIF